MRRTFLVLLALLLAVTLSAPTRAFAEEEEFVQIQVGTVSGESNGQIDLSVLLSNCAGVDSIQFDLNFDSAALEYVSMTPGDLFAAQYTVANSDMSGRVRIACASALGLEGAGTLLTLRFRVLSDTGSAVNITNGIVTRVDADYNQTIAYVSITDGGVTIGEAALPAPVATPWVPATPVPTPSPTPEPTATPEATVTPEAASPEVVEPSANGLPTAVYYVGGGLLLAVIILVVLLISRRNNDHSDD